MYDVQHSNYRVARRWPGSGGSGTGRCAGAQAAYLLLLRVLLLLAAVRPTGWAWRSFEVHWQSPLSQCRRPHYHCYHRPITCP